MDDLCSGDDAIPRQLGFYQRTAAPCLVGAVVRFTALDSRIGRDVEVLALDESSVSECESHVFRSRMLRLAAFNHPSIRRVLDAGEDGTWRFFVVEPQRGSLIDMDSVWSNDLIGRVLAAVLDVLRSLHIDGIALGGFTAADLAWEPQSGLQLLAVPESRALNSTGHRIDLDAAIALTDSSEVVSAERYDLLSVAELLEGLTAIEADRPYLARSAMEATSLWKPLLTELRGAHATAASALSLLEIIQRAMRREQRTPEHDRAEVAVFHTEMPSRFRAARVAALGALLVVALVAALTWQVYLPPSVKGKIDREISRVTTQSAVDAARAESDYLMPGWPAAGRYQAKRGADALESVRTEYVQAIGLRDLKTASDVLARSDDLIKLLGGRAGATKLEHEEYMANLALLEEVHTSVASGLEAMRTPRGQGTLRYLQAGEELSEVIDQVPPGSVIAFDSGTHQLTESVRIFGDIAIVGMGIENTTLRCTGGCRSIVTYAGDVRLGGFSLEIAANQDQYNGIEFGPGSAGRLVDIRVTGAGGAGVRFNGAEMRGRVMVSDGNAGAGFVFDGNSYGAADGLVATNNGAQELVVVDGSIVIGQSFFADSNRDDRYAIARFDDRAYGELSESIILHASPDSARCELVSPRYQADSKYCGI